MKTRDLYRDLLRGFDVPFEHAEKARKIFQYEDSPFAGSGRRINRFLVGADPEFLFESEGHYLHATTMGLRPALAFGSDQNDRLVELRPHPSRSCVEVVASTLAELRWMYRVLPSTRNLTWRSGAFAHGDGMGGHVHFGRKRPNRTAEVAALDGLAKTIRKAGLFPNAEWERRSQGDSRGQRYGQYGDIRIQRHGYEYRTLPSWLDSPGLAFLVLTLSKLVVGDPELSVSWNESTTEDPWNLLVGLAKFYKGLDDDAWILYAMMKDRSNFQWTGGDFKDRWGIRGEVTTDATGYCYPDCIAATKEDVADVMAHFTTGATIPFRECAANFRTAIPGGYTWHLPAMNCERQAGIGEVMHDLVTSREIPVRFHFNNSAGTFRLHVPQNWTVRSELSKLLTPLNAPSLNAGLVTAPDHRFEIEIGRNWRKGQPLAEVRQILKSGLLPVWTVEGVQEDSAKQFTAAFTEKVKAKKVQAEAPSTEAHPWSITDFAQRLRSAVPVAPAFNIQWDPTT